MDPYESHHPDRQTCERNSKLADVSSCVAVEAFEVFQGTSQFKRAKSEEKHGNVKPEVLKQRLQHTGLADIYIDQCQTDQVGKKLVELLEKCNTFSKHALDCGI